MKELKKSFNWRMFNMKFVKNIFRLMAFLLRILFDRVQKFIDTCTSTIFGWEKNPRSHNRLKRSNSSLCTFHCYYRARYLLHSRIMCNEIRKVSDFAGTTIWHRERIPRSTLFLPPFFPQVRTHWERTNALISAISQQIDI